MTAAIDVTYLWHEAPVPSGLPIARVHDYLICPHTGRVLIQDVEGVMGLPGGRPEPTDSDTAATFVREALEENQVRVGRVAYLGYQEAIESECRTRRSAWSGSSMRSTRLCRTRTGPATPADA